MKTNLTIGILMALIVTVLLTACGSDINAVQNGQGSSELPPVAVVTGPEICTGNEAVIRSFPAAGLPESLPNSLEGYELYSYRQEGDWFFTFQVGLNRLPTDAASNAPPPAIEGTGFTFTGLEELQTALDRLPEGEHVTWCGFERPTGAFIADIEARSRQIGLQLTVTPE